MVAVVARGHVPSGARTSQGRRMAALREGGDRGAARRRGCAQGGPGAERARAAQALRVPGRSSNSPTRRRAKPKGPIRTPALYGLGEHVRYVGSVREGLMPGHGRGRRVHPPAQGSARTICRRSSSRSAKRVTSKSSVQSARPLFERAGAEPAVEAPNPIPEKARGSRTMLGKLAARARKRDPAPRAQAQHVPVPWRRAVPSRQRGRGARDAGGAGHLDLAAPSSASRKPRRRRAPEDAAAAPPEAEPEVDPAPDFG